MSANNGSNIQLVATVLHYIDIFTYLHDILTARNCTVVNNFASLTSHATLQLSSNSLTFPGISYRSINIYWTTRGIQTGLCVLPSEYCGTIGSPSCACQLYLTELQLCLFRDHLNCGSTPQANHNSLTFPNFLDISLANIKFPQFSRFAKWVIILLLPV